MIDKLKKEADEFYNSRINKTPSLLTPKQLDFEKITEEDRCQGHYQFIYKEINWDCFIDEKENTNRLYVFLNGAQNPNGRTNFARWTWAPMVNGSVINIGDPMLKMFKSLRLGWYYGNNSVDYCDYIVELVHMFSEKKRYSEIYFYGSSGGGQAAIRCAKKYPGSLSIAINPQLELQKYLYADQFSQITENNLAKDTLHRNKVLDDIENYSESKYIFIHNIESPSDAINIQNLVSKIGDPSLYSYGINTPSKNTIVWFYSANGEKPHSCVDYIPLFPFILRLANDFYNDSSIDKKYWLDMSHLWKDHFDLQT